MADGSRTMSTAAALLMALPPLVLKMSRFWSNVAFVAAVKLPTMIGSPLDLYWKMVKLSAIFVFVS